jgi:hypothetical protein
MAEVIDIDEHLCSWRASGALNLLFLPNTKIIQAWSLIQTKIRPKPCLSCHPDENQAKTMPVLPSGRKSDPNYACPAIRTNFENFELAPAVRTKIWKMCPDENRPISGFRYQGSVGIFRGPAGACRCCCKRVATLCHNSIREQFHSSTNLFTIMRATTATRNSLSVGNCATATLFEPIDIV